MFNAPIPYRNTRLQMISYNLFDSETDKGFMVIRHAYIIFWPQRLIHRHDGNSFVSYDNSAEYNSYGMIRNINTITYKQKNIVDNNKTISDII